ncbi:hypothetical protein [Lyngbya confervoides]|uniref:Uncharacterized protein n=1 Tax=Lyngbya confervoides BDU141951 TaxID=1574623 RepID=A0ABD4SYS5_9CYAN|nr:hypothetical protein [Lyngbya confervoides]MCM1981439.1 hypothetical protein [Lyngbya confervoides BDU141951]
MNPFSATPPDWTGEAIHALQFCCPSCHAAAAAAQQVWINRRSPVLTEDRRRVWQEFYGCVCGQVWWAWSGDRPPNPTLSDPRPE